MALDKTTLKAGIKAAFLAAQAESNPDNFDAAMDALAGSISDAMDTYVKSGAVNTVVTTPDTINGTGVGAMT